MASPKLNENDARQGRSGKPILVVLIVAVVLLVVGYALIGGIGTATSPDGSLEQTETIDGPEREGSQVEGDVVTPEESEPQENNAVAVPE